ncbi:MAG: DEAD/DEAH box helicase [bacterium]|nr:DEAD/DEAH box helicase [bacterium]
MSENFEKLKLIAPILKALKEEQYAHPTPIQEKAIPVVLSGKDLFGCAQTGTGKTAAFAIPVLQKLVESKNISARKQKNHNQQSSRRKIKALILTPTRELASQIKDSFDAYGRHTDLKQTVIYGGVKQSRQTAALNAGVDILIATPGRLLDLMNQGFVRLNQVELFVLDEADRMLDMGFIIDIKKIIAKMPLKKQILFFSATLPKDIAKLANSILKDPIKVAVTPPSSTVDRIKQAVYFVAKADKNTLLLHLLKNQKISSALVFSKTKHGANRIAKKIASAGITAEAIHGNKSQNARQNALDNFKTGSIRVLVATDIAARGIDVDELSHVINFDLPNIAETYVHRIGRTGRAGLEGVALSFCDHDEKSYLQDIHKLIAKTIPVVKEHPFSLDPSMHLAVKPQPRAAFRYRKKSRFSSKKH